jgi:hypothetical protein
LIGAYGAAIFFRSFARSQIGAVVTLLRLLDPREPLLREKDVAGEHDLA